MKKLFILMSALCITATCAFANEEAKPAPQPKCNGEIQKKVEHRAHREAVFERRLKLTEVQKLKAKQIREESFAKLKPVMDQIREKRKEAEMVRMSRIAVQAQEEKLAVIDKEIQALEKQAKEIRKSNMKAFEGILTREQKKILKEMKKEGRNRYHQNHPPMGHPQNGPHHKDQPVPPAQK